MMIEVSNMNDAVRMAQRLTEKVILFYCPACASFDLFENYEDRGINQTSSA
jgi:UDP-N-acetylmuramoylalanine--D-glutamate ligase